MGSIPAPKYKKAVPLATAPCGSRPVFAPAAPQQLTPQQGVSMTGRMIEKGRVRGKIVSRRKQGQGHLRPRLIGDEYLDVPLLRDWVDRGSTNDSDRRIKCWGRMMDLWEAETLLDQDSQLTGRPIAIPLKDWEYMQKQVWGSQQQLEDLWDTRPQLNAAVFVPGITPESPMGMAMSISQQPKPFSAQQFGFQQPNIPHSQAVAPVPQLPVVVSQHVDHLLAQQFRVDYSVLQQSQHTTAALPDHFGLSQQIDFLQGQSPGFQYPFLQQLHDPAVSEDIEYFPNQQHDSAQLLSWAQHAADYSSF